MTAGAPLEQVRGALARLHEPGALERHPLAARFGGGKGLRRALEDAVAGLVRRDANAGARAARRHELLRLRYLEALPVEEVHRRLLIGRSEYYREHERALHDLAALLPPSPSVATGSTERLPIPLTGLVGREGELAEIDRLLRASRLLTLTGPGGSGKTRLALQAAERVGLEYPNGVHFVQLAPLTDPALVPSVVAAAVQVREPPGSGLVEALVTALRHQRRLLVLDNCEHLLDASAALAQALLQGCRGVAVLTTSREPLGIAGEVPWRVPALSVPASVQLFVARAATVSPGFRLDEQNQAAVAEICRRLDGLPLAIELAAARMRMLPVERIAAGLGDRLRLLTGGSRTAPAHQRTMAASIDWSHDLLSHAEGVLFRRLAVFAGGFTLEAAAAVGDLGLDTLELLTGLVDKSLVVAEERGGRERFRLLETIHEYAAEKLLSAGEAEATRERHAAHALALAERAGVEPASGPFDHAGLDELETEHDNLRAALAWCSARSIDLGLRLAERLYWFWVLRDHVAEGRTRLAELLAQQAPSGDRAARAGALRGAFTLAEQQGDAAAARLAAEEWLRIARDLEDRPGIVRAAQLVGRIATRLGEFESAGTHLRESRAIADSLGDKLGAARALHSLGALAEEQGDITAGRALREEGVALSRESGQVGDLSEALHNLAFLVSEQGDYAAARAFGDEALTLARALDEQVLLVSVLRGRGDVAVLNGDLPRARSSYDECLVLSRAADFKLHVAGSIWGLGKVARLERDFATARSSYDQALALNREIGQRYGIAELLHALAELSLAEGDLPTARRSTEESLALFRAIHDRPWVAAALHALGEVASREGELDSASALFRKSLAIFQALQPIRPSGRRDLARCLTRCAGLHSARMQPERAAPCARRGRRPLLRSRPACRHAGPPRARGHRRGGPGAGRGHGVRGRMDPRSSYGSRRGDRRRAERAGRERVHLARQPTQGGSRGRLVAERPAVVEHEQSPATQLPDQPSGSAPGRRLTQTERRPDPLVRAELLRDPPPRRPAL